jgi:hypothetical protein
MGGAPSLKTSADGQDSICGKGTGQFRLPHRCSERRNPAWAAIRIYVKRITRHLIVLKLWRKRTDELAAKDFVSDDRPDRGDCGCNEENGGHCVSPQECSSIQHYALNCARISILPAISYFWMPWDQSGIPQLVASAFAT